MFVDEAVITLRSGKGGDGCVSFRREKFVAAGGPDGGDGGKGGDVILEAVEDVNTLADFKYHRKFTAQNGQNGGPTNCFGKKGDDLIIRVPVGTTVREASSGLVIVDMIKPGQKERILTGGKGGKGNQHYATSTMQIPEYAQKGQEAQEIAVKLDLKVLADVGLVGYPNAGKSTFLSVVSNARPKIADYPFTTLTPQLGVVNLSYGKTLVIADIPGLIDGASEGVGLGDEFLKHLERTRVLIHIVDAAGTDGRDPVEDIIHINEELKRYSQKLASLPQVIAANKIDLPDSEVYMEEIQQYCRDHQLPLFPISAAAHQGLKPLLDEVVRLREQESAEPVVFEREYIAPVQKDSEGFTVVKTAPHEFEISGPSIDKMLGYTNLETEKGFAFFQRFLKERGILKKLEEMQVEEGDTIKLGGVSFEYYH